MVRLRGVRCATALTALAAVIVGAATMSGVAAADPTPVPPPSSIQTVVHDSPLQSTLIVYSASMNRAIPVTVLHPKDTSKAVPTLYLLNGAGGGEDSATWAAKTSYAQFFADKNVNVVTPIGGAFSYYTDWQRDDPVLGRNKWQTFLTKELPPLIDKEFKTTKANAIAGISMAGTSVLNLAIAEPKLYKAVAAYSGCARTSDPLGLQYIRMVVGDRGRGNIVNMWGVPGGPGWRANDPYLNAAKLRGTKVYMTSGTGLPGQYDRLDSPLINGDPVTLANQVLLGGVIEAAVNNCTQQMVARMKQLHVPNKVLTRSGGTHSWAYWEQDLHDTWPMIEADLNAKPAPAAKAAPKK
ncbi:MULTISPECIES: alpha/beta hydrolase [unclassified Gordonia (in: high G+C Gram-positive bacteria)]|uniref:alpha/beta hydrolase n=1 Tax=unclassified Gordonia (in: high G+C Gram-positive bacteria) TaxID=2657482 RepID=UPI0007E95D5F|nr:esterase [Gordonia sp. 852002-50395_SCH5434458]OBC09483.1 esterase [Gordonia sp. 852002-50816_SCH5313054-a]OBC13285.1 esterase [Gordonia sp. 852002-50816_SCH5313054-c]